MRHLFSSAFLVVLLAAPGFAKDTAPDATTPTELSELPASAIRQIAAIAADKAARTPAQRKISSSLLYLAQEKRAALFSAAGDRLPSLVKPDAVGRLEVDILTTDTKRVTAAVEAAGGTLVHGSARGRLVRARVLARSLLGLAQRREVLSIRPALLATLDRQATRERVRSAVATLADGGSVVSEGVAAHRVDEARHFYGLTGAGVKIGVLSDSDDHKEESIASGDLPADTVTLPGQDGRPRSGEGTAMMEIVHDVAPAAQIFFATGFAGPESFADNIRALRAAGCDIIVDDVLYYVESPFQDDIVAKAVLDVIADGATYFSSAGNSGALDNGTSGVWEGDFKKAKGTIPALAGLGEIHDFGRGVVSNRVELEDGPLYLHWSDPGALDQPQSGNDYDLYLLDPTLSSVLIASTDVQDGDDLPFEFLAFSIPVDLRVVVVKSAGEDRALRLTLSRGELALATAGAVYGHNSAPGAFAVAAVDSGSAAGGAFVGGATNPVEIFSSDGNRRVFYDATGAPYKPGRFTFKQGGAVNRPKPDLAAADGVSTTLPAFSGLNPFFGTSAAAPHAAAIAGLLRSAKPTLKPGQLRAALSKTALDIEAPGKDRDSGAGIVDAFAALGRIHAVPAPFLVLSQASATEDVGDGDGFLEPGESALLTTALENKGGAATEDLAGVLTTADAGVVLTSAASGFPEIAPGGGTGANETPFAFSLDPAASCGLAVDFTLTASYSNGPLSPQDVAFKVRTGKPDGTPVAHAYAGSPVPIPDGNADGVEIPLMVSGAAGAVSRLVFSIDGSSCSSSEGALGVGIEHSFVGDLVLELTSPSGTTVALIDHAGSSLNSGNNICQTVLDDDAARSIQGVLSSAAPFSGTFRPASPLSAFVGESPNGTWTLRVADDALVDTGVVHAFSLHISGSVCD